MRGLLLALGSAAVMAFLLVWGFAAGTYWFTFPFVFSGIGGAFLGIQWLANGEARRREYRVSQVVREAIAHGAQVVDIATLVRARGLAEPVEREYHDARVAETARRDADIERGEWSGR